MFRYYLGISIMCVIFAVFALFLAHEPAALATIFVGIAGAFLSIAFITSGPESRW
ncbi:hypothetical protein [Effusibacillus lacus]|uniref:Uncharacterized protein n=1 Tax=Effusibacillus lacus TaxID=1348429 RepID=A0A292YTL1_9BACL|nr:hypothetical protein [Effusibacillus lacus]TCS76273.1 hypothetical protein EDD64_10337 [Effusibacillus lacus]GAX91820.1 hypothetical protein EFBL_3511 [Effusibacillus lacus]